MRIALDRIATHGAHSIGMKREPLPTLDEASLKQGDELLRRMLEAPPKPHEDMTAKKAAKKRAKKPRK